MKAHVKGLLVWLSKPNLERRTWDFYTVTFLCQKKALILKPL